MSLVDSLLDGIEERLPMQRKLLAPMRVAERERRELERYVTYAMGEGDGLESLVDSYQRIVDDTVREQLFFMRHRRYRYKSFAEVKDQVYFDPAYMRLYMHGLALTSFLWPNHAAMRRHLLATLASIPDRGEKRYLEVGPGHGFYMAAAAELGFAHVEGIDLSPTSIELTGRILKSGLYGHHENCRLRTADLLDAEFEQPFDVIVMGEVLEHVEEPQRFLERLRQLADHRATIYLTTCANSPAVDHIYCFNDVDEIITMAERSGLRVVDSLALPYPGTTLAESLEQRLAVNVALRLEP